MARVVPERVAVAVGILVGVGDGWGCGGRRCYEKEKEEVGIEKRSY